VRVNNDVSRQPRSRLVCILISFAQICCRRMKNGTVQYPLLGISRQKSVMGCILLLNPSLPGTNQCTSCNRCARTRSARIHSLLEFGRILNFSWFRNPKANHI
jgi:hypothetical protein